MDGEVRFATDPELIKECALRLAISEEDAYFLINEMSEAIVDVVDKTGVCKIRKLGVFYIRSKRNAKYRNPQTGAEIKIPLQYKIGFKPSNTLKGRINMKVKQNLKVAYNHAENI